jgi:hypothetical protein
MDPVETIPAPEKAKLRPTTTQPTMATMSLDPVVAREKESKQEAVMRLRGGYCGYGALQKLSNGIDSPAVKVAAVSAAPNS